MKENNIEEDIKILKELGQEYYKNGEIKIKALSGAKYIWALQNLLSDYKRALKENEKLKDKLLDTLEGQKVIEEETPQYIKENYIPVGKIKKELKELKEEYVHIQEIKREKEDFGEENSKIQMVLLNKIEALQDLLN